MIWLAMAIPFLGALLMAVLFTKKIAWWEYLGCLLLPLIAIVIAKQASIHSQTTDTEIRNFYITRAEYYEPWDEYIHRTCTESYACGSDSKGNTQYCTRTYDCSYVDYHSAQWIIYDNTGNGRGISASMFAWLCNEYGNKTFKDMHRGYHSIDGDMYYTTFNGKFEKLVPLTEQFTYENRIQCSKSVFNFKEVDTSDIKRYGLFKYPAPVLFDYKPILGWKDSLASLTLARSNGLYGSLKKVHMMMLVFKDKPYDAAMLQENLWKGGNKNEFILCVGVSKDTTIQWTKVISWTDVDVLKIRVARQVKEMKKFNAQQAVKIMVNDASNNFVKKNFRDFNYITVEPTTTAIVWAYIIVFLITLGWVIFSVKNGIDMVEEERSYQRWRRM
jgi:hypothetical protein